MNMQMSRKTIFWKEIPINYLKNKPLKEDRNPLTKAFNKDRNRSFYSKKVWSINLRSSHGSSFGDVRGQMPCSPCHGSDEQLKHYARSGEAVSGSGLKLLHA